MGEVYRRPVSVRLDLCRELLSLRQRIDGADADHKIKVSVVASRRVRAIRRVLLGREGVSLADELLTPGVANARLLSELKARKDKPLHQRVATAAYVRAIMGTIRVIQHAESRLSASAPLPGFDAELTDLVHEILPLGKDLEQADSVIDTCIELGAMGDEIRNELVAAKNAGADEVRTVSTFTARLAENYEKVSQQERELYSKVKELRERPDADRKEVEELWKEYTSFLDEVYVPVQKAATDVAMAETAKAQNAYALVGRKIIDRVMGNSPITEDEATRWATDQEVTPTAVARLRKIGYPVNQLRADMAEFYRFTGGRVASVRVHSNGSRRANATDIEAHGKVGTINLDSSFNKRVLWHELAHHMEADPVAKMAAGRFIRRRSVDGKIYSLRSLSGSNGYRSNEVAYQGNFFNPYVGKVYNDGVTEVFSMGVESFSNPELLARRCIDDPQTLEFVAGFLKAPMDPLARAHMSLREIVTGMNEEANEATEASAASRIKSLAAGVEFTTDKDKSWLDMVSGGWILKYHDQLGVFGDNAHFLFAGKVRNVETKRKCNGLILVRLYRRADGTGYTSNTEIPTTDIDVAKAMMALYQKNGLMPSYWSMRDESYLRKNAAQ